MGIVGIFPTEKLKMTIVWTEYIVPVVFGFIISRLVVRIHRCEVRIKNIKGDELLENYQKLDMKIRSLSQEIYALKRNR
jgi:uncharacterized membrane-anchored protein YhcB (DUF1043 family)